MADSPAYAFLFPGQGSQRVGMGADLQRTDPEIYERWLELADSISGLPVKQYSLEGPIESLTETQVAQPAIFALSLAVAERAQQMGLRPQAVAGHSLGEYTAAVAAGSLAADAGVHLVVERGRLMARAQHEQPGTMAAISGLSPQRLAEICTEASSAGVVVVANLNSDRQVVVSGEVAAVERAMELAVAAGAEQATRLRVGAAFHSPLMKPVQEALGHVMESIEWSDARVPLYSNADARPVRSAADVKAVLLKQIASPVRWVDCVNALRADGCEIFLELGPGRVLTGLVKLQNRDADASAADSVAKVEKFIETHGPAGQS